jgi:transcriptional regulator with XRE-family HTH domain
MTTALLLRGAREGAGVPQRALARRCGVAQSSINVIESGTHDTTIGTLDRVVAGFDAQVAILPSRLLTAQSAAAVAAQAVLEGDVGKVRSAVFQLADDLAQASLHLRVALTVAPPQLTGDSRYDAWIAGLVELRLGEVGVPAPDWAFEDSRTFDDEWLVSGFEPLRASTRIDTPEPLRRRGVIIGSRDLTSV